MKMKFKTRAASISFARAFWSPVERRAVSYFRFTAAKRAFICLSCARSGNTAAAAIALAASTIRNLIVIILAVARCLHCPQAEGDECMRTKLSYLMSGVLLTAGIIYAASHTDYDHHANFTGYHTYSWIGVSTQDPLWKQRIMSAVDSELAAKGLTRVESGGDLSVSAVGTATEK